MDKKTEFFNGPVSIELAALRVKYISRTGEYRPVARDYVVERKTEDGTWKRLRGVKRVNIDIDAESNVPTIILEMVDSQDAL